MRNIHQWLQEYGESHQNHTNKAIHWICVPLIMFSIIGLLWSIPLPFIHSIFLNLGTLFLAFALFFYLRLSFKFFLGMLMIAVLIVWGNYALIQLNIAPLWLISLSIFTLAWVGQFYGHKVEGKKPSFLKDLQFLLIGPAWLLSFIYKKIGIIY